MRLTWPIVLVWLTAVQPAPDTSLAHRIEHWFHTSVVSDDPSAVLADAKQFYLAHGLPTSKAVGDMAAYEFVVLLANGKLPAAFRARVLTKVRRAAADRELPGDAATFYDARFRLQELKQRALSHPPSNPLLRDEIGRLYAEDQAVRQQKGFDAAHMKATDERHAPAVQAILDKNGVPTYSVVGPEAAREFIDLIQHQPPAFRSRVLPALRANVEKGEADPESYALVYDRSQRDAGKKQLYGEQLECHAGQQMHEAPIADEAHVNERRAELGLIRVELYARLVAELMPQFCPPAKAR